MSAPEDEEATTRRAWSTQMTNFVVYHLLISLVNLLNLPLARGTYVPRRSSRLTVLTKDLDHLKLLKSELASGSPEAVRAYLLASKSLLFEIEFLLAQDPALKRTPEFFEGFERLETLLYNAQRVEDFGEIADQAYRLSILLPFHESEEGLADRRAQAETFDRQRARRRA